MPMARWTGRLPLPCRSLRPEFKSIKSRTSSCNKTAVLSSSARWNQVTPPNPSRFPAGRYYVVRYQVDGSLDTNYHTFTAGRATLYPLQISAFLRSDDTLVADVSWGAPGQ